MSLKPFLQNERDSLDQKAKDFIAGAKALAAVLEQKREEALAAGSKLSAEDEASWSDAIDSSVRRLGETNRDLEAVKKLLEDLKAR